MNPTDQQPTGETAPPLSCLRCQVSMVPAQVRNVHVYVQPRGRFLNTEGTEVEVFVCPRCGGIDARVSDLTLFQK